MKIDLSAWSLHLPSGAAMRLEAARGVTVRGVEGRLWLTEEGSAEDVFLCAGDAHAIRTDGRVVVQADDDAALVLESAGRALPPARLGGPRGWLARAALPLRGGRYAAA